MNGRGRRRSRIVLVGGVAAHVSAHRTAADVDPLAALLARISAGPCRTVVGIVDVAQNGALIRAADDPDVGVADEIRPCGSRYG